MAAIFTRKKSRFYWVNYRDPATGKVMQKSTGLDRALPTARRDAELVAAEWTVKEMAAPRSREIERWETWARVYLEKRYAGTGSFKNALRALTDLMAYFKENEIRTPRQVTYPIAAAFVPWRVSKRGLRPIKQNSAKLRFVYFRILMGEAVRRGFATVNHCREVKNKGEPPKEKEEITTDHEAEIELALLEKPEWMRDQWTVLMCQGCRIAETNVPLSRINTERMTIAFRLKGGRLHTAPMHPDILPILERAKAAGRETLIDGPPVGSWSAIWSDFFKRRKLPYSIHCTRVSVITRLFRKKASVAEICDFIGHSEEVNRIYRKMKPQDSRSLLKLLGGAPSPAADSTGK